jgi:hypothetical protein
MAATRFGYAAVAILAHCDSTSGTAAEGYTYVHLRIFGYNLFYDTITLIV